jgi:phage terminase large subunit-like protein
VNLADALENIAAELARTAEQPNMLGYTPHEMQQRFHRSPARLRQYIGGNRAGKTTAGIIEALWWATKRHPFRTFPNRPIKGRVVAVDYDHGVADIILPALRRWILPSDLIRASWEDSFDRQLRTLTLANGSTIQFMSGESALEKFAGVSRDFVWFDEEPSQAVFTENRARTVDAKGNMWITMTPIMGQNWSYEQIYLPGTEGKRDNPDIDVIEADMADNPHLDADEVQRFVATLSNEEREARVHGRYTALGGLVYPGFNADDHVVPAQAPPAGWPIYASMDHGLAAPTAWLWHAVGPGGQVLTFAEHYAAEMTADQHAAVLLAREMEWRRPVEYRIGDPSIANRQQAQGIVNSIHLDYLRAGVNIILGDNNVEAGINRVRRYLMCAPGQTPRWQCTTDCVNLIREMRHYRWKTYISPKMRDRVNKFEVPLKKNDHACDSLRYFLMSRPDTADLAARPKPHEPGGPLAPGQRPSMEGPVMQDPFNRPKVLVTRKKTRDSDYGDFELVDEHMGGMW